MSLIEWFFVHVWLSAVSIALFLQHVVGCFEKNALPPPPPLFPSPPSRILVHSPGQRFKQDPA